MGIFSTIMSPVFSELATVHTGYAVADLPQELALFETLRKMNGVRSFELVFLLQASDFDQEKVWLERALDSVTKNGLLDLWLPRLPSADRHDGWDTFLSNFDSTPSPYNYLTES